MFTAAVSTILGMLGGVIPDLLKEFRDSRNQAREVEHMRVQAELQAKAAKELSDNRLREVESGAYAAEAQAFRETLTKIIEAQARPTGIAWIDGFNAVLRPLCTLSIMILFMVTAGMMVWGVMGALHAGAITPEQAAAVIWGSLVGESIQAALGFLYGYRSAVKK
jgi:ABC-type multidrug transport system fused ATPase/permease subunit